MITSPLAGPASLLATAVLCWPGSRPVWRLRRAPGPVLPSGRRLRVIARAVVLPVVMVAGATITGVGGSLAAAAITVFGVRYWRSRRTMSRRLADLDAFARGVRLLVAQLRAGAHPVAAVEGAAADSAPGVRAFFRDLAGVTRLGGDATSVLQRQDQTEIRLPAGRLLRAWALAQRHGVALADVLDAVRRDVEHGAAHLRESEATMAGPRATAAVLCGLPVLSLLLGEATGARPVEVLATTSFGQVLLVIGTGLLCAGLLWTMRLTDSEVRS